MSVSSVEMHSKTNSADPNNNDPLGSTSDRRRFKRILSQPLFFTIPPEVKIDSHLIVIHLQSYCWNLDGCIKLTSDLSRKFLPTLRYHILIDCKSAKFVDLNLLHTLNRVLEKFAPQIESVVIYNLPLYLQIVAKLLSSLFNMQQCLAMKFANSFVDVFSLIPFSLAIDHFRLNTHSGQVHCLPCSNRLEHLKQALLTANTTSSSISNTFSIIKVLFSNT